MRKLGLLTALLMALSLLPAGPAGAAGPDAPVDNYQMQELDLWANDLVYDATRGVLYASIDQDASRYAGRVIEIDPETGAIGRKINLGGDPMELAIDEADTFLYVGRNDVGEVSRIELDSFTKDLDFALGSEGPRLFYAADIEAVPGTGGHSVAVARSKSTSPPGEGVAIYDDGVPRPATTPDHIGENSIIFGDDPGTLFGSDLCCSDQRFYVVTVDASGATRASVTSSLGGDELAAYSGGLIYTEPGRVVDPGLLTEADSLAFPDSWRNAVAVSEQAGRLFAVGADGTKTATMAVFDLATHEEDGEIVLGKVRDDPRNLVVAGSHLAFTAGYQWSGDGDTGVYLVHPTSRIEGHVKDNFTGQPAGEMCVLAASETDFDWAETDAAGFYSLQLPSDTYAVFAWDCNYTDYYSDLRLDIDVAEGSTKTVNLRVWPTPTVGAVDPATSKWSLLNSQTGNVTEFFFGTPVDIPMVGDWDCDGVDTPGLYRQSDGYVYLRNSNTTGPGEIRFFLGNPGDIPLPGDFDGDGCDTVSVYRPSQGRAFIADTLGANDGYFVADYDYFFGDPGDRPFTADFDGDGLTTVGLYRESTGFVYLRNANTSGMAESSFFYGEPSDRILAADWEGDFTESVGIYRPTEGTWYLRFTNVQGEADQVYYFGDESTIPVAGVFGLTS